VPIPKHPRIHHLGFLEDEDKYDAMAASEVLIMPSYLESLSMVALEAWAMGKPVLANARCDVLQGQCLRSNAGLFYANYAEFCETLRAIDTTPSLQAALGRNGRAFFERHYAWPVVIKKYTDMLHQLSREKTSRTMEPLPGWLARRRRTQPPADSVVKQLPIGPYKPSALPSTSLRAGSLRPSAPQPSSSAPPQAQRSPKPERPAQKRFEGRPAPLAEGQRNATSAKVTVDKKSDGDASRPDQRRGRRHRGRRHHGRGR
jgi:hypothetical protein